MLNYARRIIAAKLVAEWTSTQIAWPNGKPLLTRDVPWMRVSLVPYGRWVSSSSVKKTKGMDGDLVLQIFVPTGTGDGQATQLADAAVSLFDGFISEGLVCLTPREPTIRGDDGRGWFQIDVAIPFRVEVEA